MNIAFIPVRGGSKSIPLKNIKRLAGKPLVFWVADAANKANFIDKVIVATDDDRIKSAVDSMNLPKVCLFDRDAENATDTASTESVMLEFISKSNLNPDDNIFLIQATSPLLEPDMIDDMFQKFIQSGKDSALSAVRNKRFFWNDDGVSLNYDVNHRPRRQDFSGCLMENGAVYINSVKNIFNSKCRLSGTIFVYEMSEQMGIELDEPIDWIVMEQLLVDSQTKNLTTNKTFCFDIDGVIGEKSDIKDMDGSYANNIANKEIIRICNMLYANGNKIVLYTARGSGSGIDWNEMTKKQLDSWGLKYHELHFGKPAADFYIDDKMLALSRLCRLFE